MQTTQLTGAALAELTGKALGEVAPYTPADLPRLLDKMQSILRDPQGAWDARAIGCQHFAKGATLEEAACRALCLHFIGRDIETDVPDDCLDLF